MAIKGSLKEASLPDVLQLLAMGKKTGCLAVTHRNNFGYVYFDKGRICFASIVNRRDRLGDLLVKGGAITKEQLESIRDQTVPGTSVLFAVTDEGNLDRLGERMLGTHMKLIETNLTPAERAQLLESFGGG